MPSEYILRSDGRVFKRPFELTTAQDVETSIDNAIWANLAQTESIIKIPNLAFWNESLVVSASLLNRQGTMAILSVQLPFLRLDTGFTTNGQMVAASFEESDTRLNLQWARLAEMKLVFASQVECEQGVYDSEISWLFALDADSRCYLLPLPNLYDDCHICVGDQYTESTTILGAFHNTLQAFLNAPWSRHLLFDHGTDRFKHAQELFKFINTSKGFEQVPLNDDWRKYCVKVGTPILEKLAL